ncbi:MAG: acyl-CoA dehydrogenase, partial [Bacteroidota bacterium]
RVEKLLQKRNENEISVQIAIVKTYFYDLSDKMGKAAKDALNSFASGDELRMMLMGVKRFTKQDHFNPKDARQLIALHALEAGCYKL